MLTKQKILELLKSAKTKYDIAWILEHYESEFHKNYYSLYTHFLDCMLKDDLVELQQKAINHINTLNV